MVEVFRIVTFCRTRRPKVLVSVAVPAMLADGLSPGSKPILIQSRGRLQFLLRVTPDTVGRLFSPNTFDHCYLAAEGPVNGPLERCTTWPAWADQEIGPDDEEYEVEPVEAVELFGRPAAILIV